MIKIVTDSSSDLSMEEAKSLGIHVIPLTITIDSEAFIDGVSITPEEFIKKMQAAAEFPKTSQPAVGEFVQLYNELAADGSEILSVHLSGKLSGTVEAARTAAKLADAKVTVIDSLFISKALAFQAKEAALMARAGAGIEKIVEKLDRVRESTHLYVSLDTLENLAKGGRIGKGTALIGSLLQIKPIANLEDGEYSPVAKVRSQTQAVKYMMKQFMRDVTGKTIKYVGIAHANGPEFALRLKERIEKESGFSSIDICCTTPVISTHTGQGAIGFSYYAEKQCGQD